MILRCHMVSAERKYSFSPVFHPECRVLILGSLPGDESLRRQEYYAHLRNAFWRILEELLGIARGTPYPERLERLAACRIALWDVAASANRSGSLDQHLTGIAPNDIPWLTGQMPHLRSIGCNGAAAWKNLKRNFPELFRKNFEIRQLPSTSPAAAAISFEVKKRAYADLFRSGGIPLREA